MSVYVYAITDSRHPLDLSGLKGVGDPPNPLRTVRAGELAAVVSDAPEDLRAKRRDLSAHHEVQERLLIDGTALPLRFGLLAADDSAVRKELEERAEQYGERLKGLEGRVEFNLKVSQEEEALLREVLEESEEARRLNRTIRSGEGTPDTQLLLGELVSGLVQARQEARAEEVVHMLRAMADEELLAAPTQDDFLNVSFLIPREKAQEFAQAEQKLADTYGDTFDFRLRGPLPPYSFV
ncbi:GvpL/GvpF family gas vesicle protein [Streptomyces sp. 8N706]|uniref:GvpL/GvpF family gas vesicle protein n=1 Tax=Streptomyces sp. 8N706 TaxID=3457416 RepID=UPI003FCF4FDA